MAAYVPLTDDELEQAREDLMDAGDTDEVNAGLRLWSEDKWLRSNIKGLLTLLAGAPANCKGCDAPIYWVTKRDGRALPYTPLGLNHFGDCPARKQFAR